MHRILAKHENLESKRKALSELLNRPVYISSRLNKSNITHVKYPGSDVYQKAPEALSLFLSQYTDNHTCVKREDYNISGNSYSNFYYDLEESQYLYLIYPTNLNDDTDILYGYSSFRHVGLFPGLNSRELVVVGNNKNSQTVYNSHIPRELLPYVREAHKAARPYLKHKLVIDFTSSELILNPKVYKGWHLGKEAEVKSSFKPINSPGWYYKDESPFAFEDTQRMAIVDKDPGGCIVCRGKSEEKRHIGVIVPEGAYSYVGSLICRSCAPGVFKEWKRMLSQ
jgi:hypothetical protein